MPALHLGARLLCAVGILASFPLFAAPATHCAPSEQVVFSCDIGRKVASICASKPLSATAGYMQYRFGRLGRKPELQHPQQKLPLEKGFDASSWHQRAAGAAWLYREVGFDVGPLSYGVSWQEGPQEAAWVTVDRPQTAEVTYLDCRRGSIQGRLELLDEVPGNRLP